jgi:hypothetical protein
MALIFEASGPQPSGVSEIWRKALGKDDALISRLRIARSGSAGVNQKAKT